MPLLLSSAFRSRGWQHTAQEQCFTRCVETLLTQQWRPSRSIATVCVAATLLALPAVGDDAKVSIEATIDDSGQNYAWVVTNHHSSPIVFIEFPHFRGDTFTAPTGWSQDWKNRAMLGGKIAPGWCRTAAESPEAAIRPDGSVKFGMRLARGGAMARPGTVTVRFSDETEFLVRNVKLPTAKSFMERNVMGIGLAVIFVIGLWVHTRKQRKAAGPAPTPASDDG